MCENINLSFSHKVKDELSVQFGNARHCKLAEIAALVNMCGEICIFGEKICLKIQSDNFLLIKKCFTLLENTFNMKQDISVRTSSKKRRSYMIWLRHTEDVMRVLMATGVLRTKDGRKCLQNTISPMVTSKVCCKRSYLRGAFLAVGSINDPNKNYHLEFVLTDDKQAVQLMDMIRSFELDAKMVARKEHYVVYLKEGEQIVDLLNVMQAHMALMELENIRIVKEMRNDINRKVNCETANINKVVGAAVKQLEDITYIQQNMGLEKLSPQLRELAEVRLKYPDKSLKELGAYLSQQVGKSGVNHRLRKISGIAEMLREGKGEIQ